MFVRVLTDSLRRQWRRKAVALAAVTLGTAAATALANIALDIGDKVSRELRGFGANLVVRPAGGGGRLLLAGEDVTSLRPRAYLASSDILKVKENFWKNNILAFAPVLDVPARIDDTFVTLRGTWFARQITLGTGERLETGVRHLHPFWQVEGSWPDEADPPAPRAGGTGGAEQAGGMDVLIGASLARAHGLTPGEELEVGVGGAVHAFRVSGVLSTGGEEDDALLAPIETVQALAGLRGKVERILVSALTTPEEAVYDRLGLDPDKMSPEEFESWLCTPFVSSISYELEKALPGAEARPILRIAESEGKVLGKTGGLMVLVAILAAVGSALTVTSALMTGVLERRAEIGLLKALGASDGGVIALFLAEAAVIGITGGLVGGAAGIVLAGWISLSIFGTQGSVKALALIGAVACALLITLSGCAVPARRIAGLRAAEVLRR
jgi:putative ABC transport system permease protein